MCEIRFPPAQSSRCSPVARIPPSRYIVAEKREVGETWDIGGNVKIVEGRW